MLYDRIARVLTLILVAFIFFKMNGCDRSKDTEQATEAAEKLVARPDVAEAVVVKAGAVVHAKKGQKPKARYVPPEGRTEIVLKTDGTLDVAVRDSGVAFSLGLAPVMNRDGVARLGLTSKVAFKGRWGLEVGLLFGKRPFVVPAAGVSYQPAWRLRNTAMLAAYDWRKEVWGGISVKF